MRVCVEATANWPFHNNKQRQNKKKDIRAEEDEGKGCEVNDEKPSIFGSRKFEKKEEVDCIEAIISSSGQQQQQRPPVAAATLFVEWPKNWKK